MFDLEREIKTIQNMLLVVVNKDYFRSTGTENKYEIEDFAPPDRPIPNVALTGSICEQCTTLKRCPRKDLENTEELPIIFKQGVIAGCLAYQKRE